MCFLFNSCRLYMHNIPYIDCLLRGCQLSSVTRYLRGLEWQIGVYPFHRVLLQDKERWGHHDVYKSLGSKVTGTL